MKSTKVQTLGALDIGTCTCFDLQNYTCRQAIIMNTVMGSVLRTYILKKLEYALDFNQRRCYVSDYITQHCLSRAM